MRATQHSICAPQFPESAPGHSTCAHECSDAVAQHSSRFLEYCGAQSESGETCVRYERDAATEASRLSSWVNEAAATTQQRNTTRRDLELSVECTAVVTSRTDAEKNDVKKSPPHNLAP
jgi:hypothetical protein